MIVNQSAYTKEHSGEGLWRITRSPCHGLPIRDKLFRHGSSPLLTCPRCMQDSVSVLHAIVQCSKISELWVYVEHLLSHLRRVQLLSKSIMKIVPSSSRNREEQACFLLVVAIAKEEMWEKRVKGIVTGIFISSLELINFFPFHLKKKIRPENRCLSDERF